jgi:hypothetical protein
VALAPGPPRFVDSSFMTVSTYLPATMPVGRPR